MIDKKIYNNLHITTDYYSEWNILCNQLKFTLELAYDIN